MFWPNRGLPRVVRQGLIGALCFSLNLMLMWALVAIFKLHILVASTLCFATLNALGHHLSRTFVFTDADNRYRHSFIRFFSVMGASLALNLAFMTIGIKLFGLHYLLTSAGIAMIFFMANYLVHRNWTFRRIPPATPITPEINAPTGISRIVCVTHFFPTRKGGIESVALEINRRLAADGILIEWFASAGPGTLETIPGLQYQPVKAIDFVERMAGIPLPLWVSKDISVLYTAIRDCNAVHVHDFIYPGSLLALMFSWRWRKPVILTQHIGHIPYRNRALAALLSTINHTVGRWALRAASRVVFISNSVETYFRSFVPFRTPPLYLANGVNLDIYCPSGLPERLAIRRDLGLGQDDPICLFVGRFVEKKGLQLLEELVRQFPNVKWLFAGEGPLRPDRWQAPNVRVLEGWRRERLANLYRAADLLILPSRGEGFPLVVQEAFACGTPVLISDEAAAGCERARDLLFECSIAGEGLVDRWTSHLKTLLAHTAQLEDRRVAVAAFARSEWSWDRSVAAYKRLYHDSSAPFGEYPESKSSP